jgi:hypothetical protein
MPFIKMPLTQPLSSHSLREPFTVITDAHERQHLAKTLGKDLEAINEITPKCPVLQQYFLDLCQDLNSSQKRYWPRIYTQEPDPDFASLTRRLEEEIARVEGNQSRLIWHGGDIKARMLVSPKGFQFAKHLLEYWDNIIKTLEM